MNVTAGNALTPEFNELFDKACTYRTISGVTGNHDEHNVLSEQLKAKEKATRQAFAEAYKAFGEKYETPSSAHRE
jgi:hypothetical protein